MPRKTFPATLKNGDHLLGSRYKGAVPADLHLLSVATRVVLAQSRRASRAVAAQLALQQRGGSRRLLVSVGLRRVAGLCHLVVVLQLPLHLRGLRVGQSCQQYTVSRRLFSC